VSLIELAIAFVTNHPAVTSAMIGPRTMEQLDSQRSAAEVELDPATLDRIDEIVQPVLKPTEAVDPAAGVPGSGRHLTDVPDGRQVTPEPTRTGLPLEQLTSLLLVANWGRGRASGVLARRRTQSPAERRRAIVGMTARRVS